MKQRKGEYEIDTDKRRLDIAGIYRFLSTESYWAKNRTLEQTLTAIENSLCFGVYRGREQVGLARSLPTKRRLRISATFSSSTYTRPRLSKWLLQVTSSNPTCRV